MKTSPELTKKLSKEFDIIKRIIKKFFDEELCGFYKRDKYMDFPAGNIVYAPERSHWGFSADYEWLLHWGEDEESVYYKIQMLFCFITQLNKNIKNFEIYEGFYNIFNEDGYFADMLWASQIEEYKEENDVPFDIAKNILTQRIIVEFEEEKKKLN